ncbi:uncharacterized protein LOC110460435 isoform X3 [Mizuhopecten yessoensis]|uniref:uncharacterized protein LOC110460435 isoform X3 n=1 Tax=Mizuhopecten yessoensis TaxID=6573 RepID=UPI000B45F545|nr:uncharacterized protein LOC110460435 isoform X3 [Mizuhopecten yessoensis]
METLIQRLSGNFKTSSPRYLGDDDPQIQAYLTHQAASPEPVGDVFDEDGVIRLYIPELENYGGEETDRSDHHHTPNSDTRDPGVSGDQIPGCEITHKGNANTDYRVKSAPPSSRVGKQGCSDKNSQTSTPKESGRTYITAHNYLQNLFPKSQRYTHKSVYEVTSPNKSDPTDNVRGRCTNVTAVLNKPIASPTETGFKKRTKSFCPSYSANSICKVGKQKVANKMNYIGGDRFMTSNHMTSGNMMSSHMTTSSSTHVNRVQEKEELQRLNDRFGAYVQRVRQLREQGGQIDSSAFLKTTKQLEDEVSNLKNLYEHELHNIRCQLDEVTKEKNLFHLQFNKSNQTAADLQDRLSVEVDKNRKITDDVNVCQRKIVALQAELEDARMSSSQPYEDINRLQRDMDNLVRENENYKRRYEKEQLVRQECEDKMSQLIKKIEFNEQVFNQQLNEARERLNISTATILSLEGRVRDLSKTDTTVPEMIRQVREAAEEELSQYKLNSENEFARNLNSLKVQMDNDAQTVERSNREKSELLGATGEFKARITSLEGQIQMLEHQKKSAEEMLQQERYRSAEQIQVMEKKFREVQDLLIVKMREANVSRDTSLPLKAEIEAMKVLLEEEERRLCNSSVFTTQQTTTTPVTVAYTAAMRPLTPSAPPISPAPPVMSAYTQLHELGPDSMVLQTEMLDPVVSSTLAKQEYETMATSPDIPSATRYTYEATPSMNRLQIEPSPPITPRPVGPVVRVKSAPASGHSNQGRITASGLVPASLGQGKDYFDEMFQDLTRETLYTQVRPKSSPTERQPTSTYHDYNTSTSSQSGSVEILERESPDNAAFTNSRGKKTQKGKLKRKLCGEQYYYASAIGDIKILEVNQEGKYVRLSNDSEQEAEFGGYMIQQNVGGHPVAVYRFPSRAKFPKQSTITIWSGSNEAILHQPPTDYVWKEQSKWGTGPECTTILCKPNGQAIAWTTAAHRFTRNAFEDTRPNSDLEEYQENMEPGVNGDLESLTDMTVNINEPRSDPVYLRREKQAPPTLAPQKHPHGISPGRESHPHSGQARPLTYGNDNSTVNRQSRSQSTRPDPVAGQPYAGAAAQKMGSAPLRKFSPNQMTRGNTNMSKQSSFWNNSSRNRKTAGTIRFGPPTPFLSPLQQEFNSRSSSLVRFTS